jgi:hypothetical protein
MVTLHVAFCVVVHPVQELNVWLSVVAGAVMVTAVPEL